MYDVKWYISIAVLQRVMKMYRDVMIVQMWESLSCNNLSWVRAVMMMQSTSVRDIVVHVREIVVYLC